MSIGIGKNIAAENKVLMPYPHLSEQSSRKVGLAHYLVYPHRAFHCAAKHEKRNMDVFVSRHRRSEIASVVARTNNQKIVPCRGALEAVYKLSETLVDISKGICRKVARQFSVRHVKRFVRAERLKSREPSCPASVFR